MQTVNFLFSNWFSCSPSKLVIPFQIYYSVPDLNKVFTNPEDGILLLIQSCINSFWQNSTKRLISLPSEITSWQNAYMCVWRTITSISSYSGLCVFQPRLNIISTVPSIAWQQYKHCHVWRIAIRLLFEGESVDSYEYIANVKWNLLLHSVNLKDLTYSW